MTPEAMKGTAVTIVHLDSTKDTVVTAQTPLETRQRLNQTLLGEEAAPPFLTFDSVDEDAVYFFNREHISYIVLEPEVLAVPGSAAKERA